LSVARSEQAHFGIHIGAMMDNQGAPAGPAGRAERGVNEYVMPPRTPSRLAISSIASAAIATGGFHVDDK